MSHFAPSFLSQILILFSLAPLYFNSVFPLSLLGNSLYSIPEV